MRTLGIFIVTALVCFVLSSELEAKSKSNAKKPDQNLYITGEASCTLAGYRVFVYTRVLADSQYEAEGKISSLRTEMLGRITSVGGTVQDRKERPAVSMAGDDAFGSHRPYYMTHGWRAIMIVFLGPEANVSALSELQQPTERDINKDAVLVTAICKIGSERESAVEKARQAAYENAVVYAMDELGIDVRGNRLELIAQARVNEYDEWRVDADNEVDSSVTSSLTNYIVRARIPRAFVDGLRPM